MTEDETRPVTPVEWQRLAAQEAAAAAMREAAGITGGAFVLQVNAEPPALPDDAPMPEQRQCGCLKYRPGPAPKHTCECTHSGPTHRGPGGHCVGVIDV